MIYADAAPQPDFVLGTAACAGLACLLLTSAVVLAIVFYRRSRKNRGAKDSASGPPDGPPDRIQGEIP